MKKWCLLILILAINSVFANEYGLLNSKYVVSIQENYQSRSLDAANGDTTDLSQFSSVFRVYMPFNQQFNLSLWGAQLRTGGDPETISGLADIQVSASYFLNSINTVFSLKTNLPSGQNSLSLDEFATAALIANPVFQMRVPTVGQGFNIAPGLVWAGQLSNSVAIGLGATYLVKGKYTPISSLGEFDPGDELLLTLGIDHRINDSATLSGNFIFNNYGTDTFAGSEQFAAGNKIVATLKFQKFFQFNELVLLTRFRSQGKSDVLGLNIQDKVIPDNFQLLSQYALVFNPVWRLGFFAEARFYESLPRNWTGGQLYGFGISPAVTLGNHFQIPLNLRYHHGNLGNDSGYNGFSTTLGITLMY